MGSGVSKQAADFLVLVKTGDRRNAGIAANVFIILHDAHGNQSEEIKLDKLLHNGFKRGKTGRFPVLNKWQLLGDIKAIEILHDGAGKSEDWLVEKIEVRSLSGEGNGTSVFPINTRLPANQRMRYYEFNCVLPQHDARGEQRRRELDAMCLLYQYDGPVGAMRQVSTSC